VPARQPIGAHVSVAGGLGSAWRRADAIGAETIQIFVANPRGWAPPQADPAGDEAFAAERAARRMRVFVHAPYLINLGSPSPVTLQHSRDALTFALRRGAAIGAEAVVVHAGSAVSGIDRTAALCQVRDSIDAALTAVDGIALLIEPTAGGGAALASDAVSLADYLDATGRHSRLGVCLDTCHLHAAGHDLSTPARLVAAVRAFARAAGAGGIGLVHVNDSRDPAGSLRDRHAAIGAGTIGLEPFGALFRATPLRRAPLVVETAERDHADDIARLRALRVG
jgi:deoxyribonuclease-4